MGSNQTDCFPYSRYFRKINAANPHMIILIGMSISKVVRDENGKEHRIGNYAHVKKFRKNKKQKLVELAGGKCIVCGYSKCIRNLTFHHVDPSKKCFAISTAGQGKSMDKLLEEVKKCIIVCCRCHGEIEDGLIDASPYPLINGTRTQN